MNLATTIGGCCLHSSDRACVARLLEVGLDQLVAGHRLALSTRYLDTGLTERHVSLTLTAVEDPMNVGPSE